MPWKILDFVMQKANDEERTRLHIANRRSEPRVPLMFPIEVSGFDRRGKYFIERTSCFDVGEISCAFPLQAEIAADSVVAIRSFHWQNSSVMESMPVLFQVVRLEDRPEGRVVAAVRLQPQLNH
jgi:hypothetical protein